MDHESFDALVKRLAAPRRRRATLKLLAGAPIALGLAAVAPVQDDPAAKAKRARRVRNEHHRRRKKVLVCVGGVTKRVTKRRRKALLKRGATRGACVTPTSTTTCSPICPAGDACGVADGCGGTCGCGVGSGRVCRAGTCVACDVTCTGDATVCGNALRDRLPQGGTILLCPGTYAGPFSATVSDTTIIGAGNGANPLVDSILDGQGVTQVMFVSSPATLQTLRVTNGHDAVCGGGIVSAGRLALEDCVVTGNTSDGAGGGICAGHRLTLTRTAVTFNTSATEGGGISISANPTDNDVFADSIIADNTATGVTAQGGGVYFTGSFLTITGTTIARNKAGQGGGLVSVSSGPGQGVSFDATSRVINNQATNAATPIASGIINQGATVTVAAGATVTGNTPLPQCSGVTGC